MKKIIPTFFSRADRSLIIGYLLIILVGGSILMLPFFHRGELNPTDAFFTATSAICVTGLIVKDTPKDFTIGGLAVILLLIQIGGVGYMTFTSLMIMMLGKPLRIRDKFILKEQMNALTMNDLVLFVKRVFRITFIFESLGAVILFFRFLHYYPWKVALGHAVFHSISAFCNAGFSTFSTNLSVFPTDWVINVVIMIEIIVGGIGFIVLLDIGDYIGGGAKFLMEHSKMVLISTVFLIVSGAIIIYFVEKANVFVDKSAGYIFLTTIFQSVTARTAGFNTIDMSNLQMGALLIIMLLMFIGASPGGTGGGIKTTTVFLLLLNALSYLRGKEMVTFNHRSINRENIERALNLFFFVVAIIATSVFLLVLFEQSLKFVPIMFEVFSAIGTVGLSLGSSVQSACSLSYDFSTGGKWLIMFLMLIGRAGIITFLTTLFIKRKDVEYKYPSIRIVVG